MALTKNTLVMSSFSPFFDFQKNIPDLDEKWLDYVTDQFYSAYQYSQTNLEQNDLHDQKFFSPGMVAEEFSESHPALLKSLQVKEFARFMMKEKGCNSIVLIAFPHGLKSESVPRYISDFFPNSDKLRVNDLSGMLLDALRELGMPIANMYVYDLGRIGLSNIFFSDVHAKHHLYEVAAPHEIQVLKEGESMSLINALPAFIKSWRDSQNLMSTLFED